MIRIPLIVAAILAAAPAARAVQFENAYLDGANWNSIYAQGFSPFVQPSPDPMLMVGDTVSLDRFEFFKSGNADITATFQLVIVDNFFVNLTGLTATSPNVIGLSSNSIAGTAGFAVGDPMAFTFQGVNLTFGADYAAIYVTNNAGALTPVLVPSLIADYIETEPGSGVFVPESNYGDPELEFQYSTSNFINTNEFGSFLASFNAPYADANFRATYNIEIVTGDYNGDGAVDAADYTVWRDNLGASITLPGETATPGQVTTEDYDVWKLAFGSPASGALSGPETPEPAALSVLALAALVGASLRTVRSRSETTDWHSR